MNTPLKTFIVGALAVTTVLPYAASAYAVIDLSPTSTTVEKGEVESVDTRFNETGKFLALVPVKFTVTVRVHPEGGVDLEYPWYSALTIDRRDKITTELQVAVNSALRSLMVGKVVGEGESLKKTHFSPEEARAVGEAVKQVLEENFGTEAK